MPTAIHPSQRRGRAAPAPTAAIPFTGAAHEHVEPITTQVVTPGAAAQAIGPFDVPAYGYLRHILLEVSGSGGALGGGTIAADYPTNTFSSLSVLDVNGAPIFGPLDGYATLWTNICSSNSFRQDPRLDPGFIGTINCNFVLRIPIEIARHSGLGALANQNAAASYKLNMTVNTLANLVTGGAPTAPALTIRAHLEAWSLPNATDLAGRPQAQVPPAHGTTMYHSFFQRAVPASGNQTILLPRVGNLIRYLLVISRDGSNVRADATMPDPMQLTWDARILTLETQKIRTKKGFESLHPSVTRDTGVFFFPFNNLNNGQSGDEEPNLWLPTVQSTRLELDGSNTGTGSLQFVTCDVAPVEVLPQERFVETSASGFHPRIGEPAPAAQ